MKCNRCNREMPPELLRQAKTAPGGYYCTGEAIRECNRIYGAAYYVSRHPAAKHRTEPRRHKTGDQHTKRIPIVRCSICGKRLSRELAKVKADLCDSCWRIWVKHYRHSEHHGLTERQKRYRAMRLTREEVYVHGRGDHPDPRQNRSQTFR